jgi:broad specificity phosphatase PhoE
MAVQRIFLVRHGETEWTLTGQHTGRTDIPLTENGRLVAGSLGPVLAKIDFALVLTSPLRRARETCELAGFAGRCENDPDLMEWDYGEYEGLTSDEIKRRTPGWMLFRDGCPGGETPDQIGARADRLIARLRGIQKDVVLFGHGHLFRVLVSRWVGLPVSAGSHFLLDPATVSVVSYYQGAPAVKRWNVPVVSGPEDWRKMWNDESR